MDKKKLATINIKGHKGKAIAKETVHRGKKITEYVGIQETEQIQNQETNFLDIPPSRNYTYDIHQFPFQDSTSMYGIFFLDSEGNPCFNFMRPYPPLSFLRPNFYTIPAPFTILSSSDGLILCRDFLTFNYHICNPFYQTPNSYRRIPSPPQPHDKSGICAVLTTEYVDDTDPTFSIVCLIEEKDKGKGYYTVDLYCSLGDEWYDCVTYVGVGARVIENSGISSSGHAFWLTEAPHCILRLGFTSDGSSFIGQIVDIHGYHPGDKIQLGRIYDVGVCLVVSNQLDVQFYVLRDEEDDPSSFEYINYLKKAENSVLLHQSLELLRFEWDAAFWVDGRIFFWQLMDHEHSFKVNSLHEMPRWVKVPGSVCDTVPYVHTTVLPSQFFYDYTYSDE